jgi:hypothetical protein
LGGGSTVTRECRFIFYSVIDRVAIFMVCMWRRKGDARVRGVSSHFRGTLNGMRLFNCQLFFLFFILWARTLTSRSERLLHDRWYFSNTPEGTPGSLYVWGDRKVMVKGEAKGCAAGSGVSLPGHTK